MVIFSLMLTYLARINLMTEWVLDVRVAHFQRLVYDVMFV